jgi:uncharacterized protein (DUF983 family)
MLSEASQKSANNYNTKLVLKWCAGNRPAGKRAIALSTNRKFCEACGLCLGCLRLQARGARRWDGSSPVTLLVLKVVGIVIVAEIAMVDEAAAAAAATIFTCTTLISLLLSVPV